MSSPELATMLYTKAASATLVAMTPGVPRVQAMSTHPSRGILWAVGISPTTPHRAAGILIEPPPSVPAQQRPFLQQLR